VDSPVELLQADSTRSTSLSHLDQLESPRLCTLTFTLPFDEEVGRLTVVYRGTKKGQAHLQHTSGAGYAARADAGRDGEDG
jgi:hypothetical protein